MKNKFTKLLQNEYVILDGAMGTMLQAAGMKMGEIPETLNITNPGLLTDIHSQYIKAGSQVVYANTFGANAYKLDGCGYELEDIVKAAISNARRASDANPLPDGNRALVALDIGPIGQLMEPTGTLSFDEAYDMYAQIIKAGREADLVVFETMTDLLEVKAGVLAAKENSELPIMVTMTFEMNQRTFTGVSVASMALTLNRLGVDAVGVNCSLGPKELEPVIKTLSKWTNLPIVLKPNAGLPNPKTNLYDLSPESFAQSVKTLLPYGIKVFGGCCGTNPDFIRELAAMLKENGNPSRPDKIIGAAVCSQIQAVDISQPRIIGERINPTGKKLFKEALLNNDIDYILNQALEQVKAGADILDVNVGLPGIDEKEMMIKVIKALQGIVDVPLQIDSTIPEVLEAALRIYNGKPIVNSVNGEEKSLETVLPLVKKYGAAVVGLTLDENGIPPKAEERFAIAKKIMDRAVAIGIPKEDVYIDCLTLTASAEQEAVMETLHALNRVKTELGLKTVLGVSNISFGLPNRELVNHIFLAMALNNGLDLPIINPNNEAMSGTVRAYKLLANYDKNSVEFIKAYADMPKVKKIIIDDKSSKKQNDCHDAANNKDANESDDAASDDAQALMHAVLNGLSTEGAQCTEELLKNRDSMEIVNDILIPALDRIGSDFEQGKIFLPQLILSANVAQAAFQVIKAHMVNNNAAPVNKGKIVIATVKGDVHDIGKNIVKVLLENYGYEVIDLGKDVEYQAVVDAVRQHNAKLVGLSALMTTTLVSMENTIKLIHENNLDCKIMVGGAVLTPEYAKQINADFYAKDAKESVDIAKRVLG